MPSDARKDTLSDTDEPSLESRVADNLMVNPWHWGIFSSSGPVPLSRPIRTDELTQCIIESDRSGITALSSPIEKEYSRYVFFLHVTQVLSSRNLAFLGRS